MGGGIASVRRAAAVVFGVLWFAAGGAFAQPVPTGPKVDVDLSLALGIDISGSVDPEEGKLQRMGYVAAFRDPQIVKAILGGYHGKIGVSYFEWADAHVQRMVVDWTLLDSEPAIMAFAEKLEVAQVGRALRTSISGAIRFALPLFDRSPFVAERQVLDLSGDGTNNDGGLVTQARDQALEKRIVINGLPIINDRPGPSGFPPEPDLDKYYEGCVIGGPRAFVVRADSFKEFGEAVRRKLLLEIAESPAARETRIASDAGAQRNRDGALLAQNEPRRRNGPGEFRPPNVVYEPGCDVGERRSRDYWQRRFGN